MIHFRIPSSCTFVLVRMKLTAVTSELQNFRGLPLPLQKACFFFMVSVCAFLNPWGGTEGGMVEHLCPQYDDIRR